MKSISIIIPIVLLLSSCASTAPPIVIDSMKSQTVIGSLDFTKYQELGFTFSPYEPTGTFESMGYIDLSRNFELIKLSEEDYDKLELAANRTVGANGQTLIDASNLNINDRVFSTNYYDASKVGIDNAYFEHDDNLYRAYTYSYVYSSGGSFISEDAHYLVQFYGSVLNELLDDMYEEAVRLGGDGIVSFKPSKKALPIYDTSLKQYSLSGYVFKYP